MSIPSSVLVKGGYDIYGIRVTPEKHITLPVDDSGIVKFTVEELLQNTKYILFLSAGNDLPHFKKDLLKDTTI